MPIIRVEMFKGRSNEQKKKIARELIDGFIRGAGGERPESFDVVFVDRAGRVLKIVERLKPWRMAASLRAYAVVELAGGNAGGPDRVAVGDRLYLGG